MEYRIGRRTWGYGGRWHPCRGVPRRQLGRRDPGRGLCPGPVLRPFGLEPEPRVPLRPPEVKVDASPSPPDHSLVRAPVEEGSILRGKYRVERVLGEGGMGIVVSAWHLKLEQRVAIKFLRAEMLEDPQIAERFVREARAASRIQGDHVV